MKVVIVEDSELARFELETLLTRREDIELVGQAGELAEALQLIPALQPDVLFLDVDLPGGTVFQLLEQLSAAPQMSVLPQLIFITAHAQYALQAIEHGAVDYLLKPFSEARLAQALARLAPPPTALSRLTGEHPVYIKDGERCHLVKLKNIRLMEAIGNYCRVYFADQSPLMYRSLNRIEERLDPAMFFRISRQFIVNLNFIAAVEPWVNGGLRVTLKDGETLEVSRRQASVLRQMMSL